jgi:hypothetical protein
MQSLNPLEVRTRPVNREHDSLIPPKIPANHVSQVSEGEQCKLGLLLMFQKKT